MKPIDSDAGIPPYPVTPEDAAGYRLLQRYLARRRGEIKTIREALDRRDFQWLQRLGHNLRGSGASYDLVRISTLGAEIEQAAERRAAARLDQAITQLEQFLRSVTLIEPA